MMPDVQTGWHVARPLEAHGGARMVPLRNRKPKHRKSALPGPALTERLHVWASVVPILDAALVFVPCRLPA
jgi:hypothetical protein